MIWMMNNGMGPRGRMNGHGEFGRRTYCRSTGMGELILILALLFGGPVIVAMIAIAGAVLTGLGVAFTGVFYGIGSLLTHLFSGTVSIASVVMGVCIGLILYRRIREKKAAAEEQKAAEETEEFAVDHKTEYNS